MILYESAAAAKAALQYPTPNNDSNHVNMNHPYQTQQQQYQYQQQQGNPISNFFSKSGHPITCIFHILFKVAAILIYLMGGVFEKSTNFVTVTVLCVISLSMDFWTVKNVTGRLLVGLRWWANEEVCTYVCLRVVIEVGTCCHLFPHDFGSYIFFFAWMA